MADTITWLDEPATNSQVGVTWLDEPAQPKVKKTRAQVTKEVEAAQAARPIEQMTGLEKVGAAAYGPARIASLQPVLQGLEELAAIPINDFLGQMRGPQRPPFVIDRNAGTLSQAPGTVPNYVPGTPLVNLPFAHPEQSGIRQISAWPQALSQVAEGLTTPGNLATIGGLSGPKVAPLVSTIVGPQMVTGAAQELGTALDSNVDSQEREAAAYRAGINAVLAGLVAQPLLKKGSEGPLIPEVLPPLVQQALPVLGPV